MAFLRRARENGIVVIGGLPTLPEGTPIDERDVERIRRLFEGAGQYFARTPELSRYPLACFFDVPYHLNEQCQIEHSERVGRLIADVPSHRCPRTN